MEIIAFSLYLLVIMPCYTWKLKSYALKIKIVSNSLREEANN